MRVFLRFVVYVSLMVVLAFLFTLMLYVWDVVPMLVAEQDSAAVALAAANSHIPRDAYVTAPIIGIFLATRSLFGRIAAGLVLAYFWIWPVVHWYWIGAPQ